MSSMLWKEVHSSSLVSCLCFCGRCCRADGCHAFERQKSFGYVLNDKVSLAETKVCTVLLSEQDTVMFRRIVDKVASPQLIF